MKNFFLSACFTLKIKDQANLFNHLPAGSGSYKKRFGNSWLSTQTLKFTDLEFVNSWLTFTALRYAIL